MHIHMSSKNVAIQKTVYNALARERLPGESFTQLLSRLLNQSAALDEMRGAWSSRGNDADLRILKSLRGRGRGGGR